MGLEGRLKHYRMLCHVLSFFSFLQISHEFDIFVAGTINQLEEMYLIMYFANSQVPLKNITILR